jgi:hypothetical protein
MIRYKFLLLAILALCGFQGFAQFPYQVPLTGNTAISQVDARFVDWAAGCTVQKGWLNIADKTLGQPTLGDSTDAVGYPGSGVVSLGDSGVAVLTFSYNIFNGAGADFAVFENGFKNPINDTQAYLELAFVEVSSDGVNFFRFPATSNMQDSVQIGNFDYSDCSYYNNLAGKYVSGFGTPFDLDDLKDVVGLDVNHISHVRIVDVVGSIDSVYGTKDQNGHIINDPYPSPYPSAGFDLNGVGVIHSLKPSPTAISGIDNNLKVDIYPNPTQQDIHIDAKGFAKINYSLTDLSGKQILSGDFTGQTILSLGDYLKGVYLLRLNSNEKNGMYKIVRY